MNGNHYSQAKAFWILALDISRLFSLRLNIYRPIRKSVRQPASA